MAKRSLLSERSSYISHFKRTEQVFKKGTRYFCPILWNLIFFDRFSKKYSNIKFNKNRSSGSRDVPCGERDRRTDMTKLTVSFRNFANAPNNVHRWLQSDSRVTNRTCFLSPRNYKISKCVQVSDYWRFGAWVTVTYLRTRRIIFEVLSATECTKTMFWKLTMY